MLTIDNSESLVFINTQDNRSVPAILFQLEATEDKREFLDLKFEILLNNSRKLQTLFMAVPSYMFVSSYSVFLGHCYIEKGGIFEGTGTGCHYPNVSFKPYFDSDWEYARDSDVSVWKISIDSAAFTQYMKSTHNSTDTLLDTIKLRVEAKWYGLVYDPESLTQRTLVLDFGLNKYFYEERVDEFLSREKGIPIISEFKVLSISLPEDAVIKPSDVIPDPYILSSSNVIWKNTYFAHSAVVSYSRYSYLPLKVISGMWIGFLISSATFGFGALVQFFRSSQKLKEKRKSSRLYDIGCISMSAVLIGFLLSFFYLQNAINKFYSNILETGFPYYVEPLSWFLLIVGMLLSYLISFHFGADYAYAFNITGCCVVFAIIGFSLAHRIGYSLLDIAVVMIIFAAVILVFHALVRLGNRRRAVHMRTLHLNWRRFVPW